MKKNATILTALMLIIALISKGNILSENPPPIRSVINKAKYGGNPSDSSLSVANGRQGGPSPFQYDESIIRYDNGYNHDAIGLGPGGTFQVAAYFPATYMAQYAGMNLTKIEFYIYQVPSSCVLKVYGPGTSTSPGSLLYQQTITPNLYWNIAELSTQFDITGQDLWFGYEVTHSSGEFPAGFEKGSAQVGYGFWVFYNSNWVDMSLAFNGTLNLAGHLEMGNQQTLDADFSADTLTGTAPQTVHFTDLSIGSPTSWQWDFNNDGAIDSEEQNPVWTYSDPGNYTVTLTVSDGTSNDTEIKQDYIVVNAPETGIINIVASQRTDGSKILDVDFDLYGTEAEYDVWLDVSFDNGVNFQTVNAVSGDTGWISPAQNQQITWNAGDEFPDGFYSKTMRVKVSADFSITDPPTVTTAAISNITASTATSGGNVTSDGGASVTARGVVWSILANPTIEQNLGMTSDGEGTGQFVSSLTGLSASTTYFLRAFATNTAGTAYGDELSFTTISSFTCGSSFIDQRDGKTYTTIQIGTQCWMKQNLNIGSLINGTSNQTNNGSIEKYCYNNSESNCDVYGGLYQWNEMMGYTSTPGMQGICPTGWHLPTDAEWTTLTTYLGGVSLAGGKLKEEGTTHWISPNTGATNSSGFTGLPGGYRDTDNLFYTIGSYGFWWSSSIYNSYNVWYRYLWYNNRNITGTYILKEVGNSVRCLKNN